MASRTRLRGNRRPVRRRRRGIILGMMLILLAVVGGVTALSLRQSLTDLRSQRRLERQIQTSLLADAGLRRAARFARQDPNYDGDTWTWQDARGGTAQVRSTLTRNETASTLTVVVEYSPSGDAPQHRLTRRLELPAADSEADSSD